MRLLDIHLEVDRPLHLDLHPRLTVVTGDATACTRVTRLLARAFALAGTELTGTIEYAGFDSPLDQTSVVALDLPGEGLLVVTSRDLPPPDRSHHEATVRATVAEREHAWAEAHRLGEMLGSLERRLHATEAAVRVGAEEQEANEAELATMQAGLATAEDRQAEMAAELEQRRRELAELQAGLADQETLAAALAGMLDVEEGAGRRIRLGDDVSAPRGLIGRARGCGLLGDVTAEVLDGWLEEIEQGTATPDPEVAAFCDRVLDVERRWAELSAIGVEDDPDVVAARLRHEELANRRAALEELAASGVLVERARSEIDDAHAERVRLEGERSRAGAAEAAAAREEEAVNRYGFGSYLEYAIALSTRSVGDAVQATLENVRAEAVGAADALDAVRERAALQRHRLSEEREAVRERFRELLDGAEVDDLSVEPLLRIPAVPAELHGLRRRLEATVGELARRRDAAASGADACEGRATALTEEVASRRRGLEEQEDRIDHLAPLLVQAQTHYEQARAAHADMEQQVAEAESEVADLDARLVELQQEDVGTYSAADVPEVVTHLNPLIDPPAGEPVPVVMADAFGPLGSHATAALEAMTVSTQRVQIVYVTDDESVIRWAERLDEVAGRLIRLQRPGWFQRQLARWRVGA